MLSLVMQSNDNEKLNKTNQEGEVFISLAERKRFLQSWTFDGKAITVLMDTGINECLVRKDLMTNSYKIMPSPIKTAKLSDGNEVDLIGYVEWNPTFEGKTLEMHLYVVAELPYPMVLGANWLRMTGAYIPNNTEIEGNGIGLSNVLIDTGCTSCFVRRDDLTDSMKSKIEPVGNHSAASLIDGSKMDVLGYVYLCVSYLGKTVELPCFVVAELSHPMILGTTWIHKSGAILKSDGTKLGVTFNGKEENIIAGDTTEYCFPSPSALVEVERINDLVSALIDTGASKSLIKKDILTDDQKSKATQISTISTIADGKQIKELTELVSLNITFQDIPTFMEKVYIPSHLDDQLVLGMDWIHQTRAVIQSDGSKIVVSQPEAR